MKLSALLLLSPLVAIMAVPALSQPRIYDSVYTEIDDSACTERDRDEISVVLECPGHAGTRVRIVDSDLRMTVSYGANAENERTARQGFAPFNHLGPRIEWLINDQGALSGTILRWYVAQPDPTLPDHQILVVTRVAAGNTCHVAYVDARANANANTLARSAAEMILPDFDCASDSIQTWGQWRIPGGVSSAL